MNQYKPIRDIKESFWTLAFILCGSTGLSGMILGWQLANKFGASVSIGSLCVGNLLIWLIGMAIITMASHNRINSIENIKKVLGNGVAILSAIFLIIAFLSWNIYQLKSATIVIDDFFQINKVVQNGLSIRIGAALGAFASLIAIGGFRIIKWMSFISFPLMIFYYLFGLISSDSTVVLESHWKLSLSVISSVVLFYLLGIINFPTLFRHSRSLEDSYLALTIMTVVFTFFQISSFYLKVQDFEAPDFYFLTKLGISFQLFVIAFIIITTVTNMLVNIYFASACWEFAFPKFEGTKEYAIIGLIGTAAYTFIQISAPMKLLIDLSNYFLANLGIVLLLTSLLEIVVKKNTRILGRAIGISAWIAACIAAIILEVKNPNNNQTHTLLFSMGVCTLFFLGVIFIEETAWSIKKIIQRKKSSFDTK